MNKRNKEERKDQRNRLKTSKNGNKADRLFPNKEPTANRNEKTSKRLDTATNDIPVLGRRDNQDTRPVTCEPTSSPSASSPPPLSCLVYPPYLPLFAFTLPTPFSSQAITTEI